MARSRTSTVGARQEALASPHNPNQSFVCFPSGEFTGRVARVSLESLLRQVEANDQRLVKQITFVEGKLIIDWRDAHERT